MSQGHPLAARHPEARYVTWAFIGSVIVHAGILGAFIRLSLLEPPKLDLAQKPISAKLVRQGVKRDESLLPRKDIAVPPPPQAAPAPQPITVKPRDPASGPSTAAAKTAPTSTTAAPPAKNAEQKRRDLFKAFDTTSTPRSAEPAVGDPNGDPEGDSDTAGEAERYFGLVLAKARRNYEVTKTIPPQELVRLKAIVVLYINATGELLKSPEVQVSSGNEQFDQDVILSLKKAAPFGPPPKHLVEALKTVGVAIQATP